MKIIKVVRILYLYAGSKKKTMERVRLGEKHSGLWGMLYLPEHGIEADYIEIEQFFPDWLSRIFRKIVNIHLIHLPLFWKIFSYDIIFTSTSFGTQFIYTLLSIKKPLWVMHDFSITGLLGEGKTLRQKIFRYTVERSNGIVTLSIDEKERLERMFPHVKIEFIPFGIDLNFFKPQRVREESQILAVGFDPDRDWKTLVAATKDIDVKVILATRIDRVKSLLPLPSNVEVKQFSARELVLEYAKSSVIVVPLDSSAHNNDAMGCSVLFEGMAMGKPTVVTRTKTMETYVADGKNGFLVEERDVRHMRNTILKLLGNKSLRWYVGQNARRYAIENLDAKKCAAVLADFFKKIYKEAKE